MKKIDVLHVLPVNDEYEVLTVKATPSAISKILGGEVVFIELTTDLGLYCLSVDINSKEEDTQIHNFSVLSSLADMGAVSGPVVFVKHNNQALESLTEAECEKIAMNLVDTSTYSRVLFLDKLANVTNSQVTGSDLIIENGDEVLEEDPDLVY